MAKIIFPMSGKWYQFVGSNKMKAEYSTGQRERVVFTAEKWEERKEREKRKERRLTRLVKLVRNR